VRPAAVAFGLVSAAGLITLGAGFAFDTYGSNGKWIELGNEMVFVLIAVAVIARGSPAARGIAGGALGLLGLFAGLQRTPVLLHGVVLSGFFSGPGTCPGCADSVVRTGGHPTRPRRL
jgi:hypothetical protein